GVTSTGIYCRPICPAGPAKLENCRFFPSAAAAQEAGFRPCLRCRPEIAPDLAAWRGTANTVSRGLELIADGELDGANVTALAERLGVGERQLRRLFQLHLGASPIAVAQTRRVLFAKQLVHDTRLPMTEIALAAGFGSVRRFNECFRSLFGRPPTELRRKTVVSLREGSVAESGVTVRLRYRPPYDWESMLAFFRRRAVAGIEVVDEHAYRRTIRHEDACGTIEIVHVPELRSIAATIRFPSVRALPAIVARIRRAFDVAADVSAIGRHLARDPMLAPLVRARRGLRVPGGWDGFEVAVRAILGQQITVEAGRALVSRLVELCGARTETADPALFRVFPEPAQVLHAELSAMGMPAARREALRALSRAALDDARLFDPMSTVEETVSKLRGIRGVGEWTAQYVALRASREPDAFPASDVGLLRAAGLSPDALLARAERWRPFRAYAAQHLWSGPDPRRTT
ncbi:MAG: AlkA N-terminal domain-containing protein, partial [Polyangiales bacterium]